MKRETRETRETRKARETRGAREGDTEAGREGCDRKERDEAASLTSAVITGSTSWGLMAQRKSYTCSSGKGKDA